jgi:hypothetical protein
LKAKGYRLETRRQRGRKGKKEEKKRLSIIIK